MINSKTFRFKKNGTDIWDILSVFAKNCNELGDGDYDVLIRRHVEHRTNQQNRLYRIWLRCIADETGNDVDVLHEVFKSKFLIPEAVKIGECTQFLTGSTTKLSTKAFADYMECIRAFCSTELGMTLPTPEEVFFAENLQ